MKSFQEKPFSFKDLLFLILFLLLLLLLFLFFFFFFFKPLSSKSSRFNENQTFPLTNHIPDTIPETSNLLLPLKDGQVVAEQAAQPEAVAVNSPEVSEEELEDQRLLAELEKEMEDNQEEIREAEVQQLGRYIEEEEKRLNQDLAENQQELQDLETLQTRQLLIQDIMNQKTTLETAVEKTMKVGSKVMSGLHEIVSDLSTTLSSTNIGTSRLGSLI